MLKVTIIDGYVDEPTCLGVPPYISPYPRYISGSIWEADNKNQILYFTIDQLRNNQIVTEYLKKSDLIIVIAGMSVPGRYLSGYPISPNETIKFFSNINNPLKILCGPAAKYGFGLSGGKKTIEIDIVKNIFDLIVKGDCEIVISNLLKNNLKIENIDPSVSRKNASEIKNYAFKGSKIVTQHPNFPDYLICEIETYRGCPRSIVGGCSFCSEPLKGPPDFREIKEILKEIKTLYEVGVRNFRIGNQPCIFSYMSKDAKEKEFPKPNPQALEQLFNGIRRVAPVLRTLHIDNANPGILARYPIECKKIVKTIIKYHTPGDVAALGVETVDPVVIKENNLKASSTEVHKAIKLLNEIGGKRGINGMPELLPGLNFVFGLKGETKKTFELNYEFLKKMFDENLILRRINVRQIIPIPGTKIYDFGTKLIRKHKHEFKKFKRKIQENIERPMLEKMLPKGTKLSNVYTEKYQGKLTFSRQLGSYPLLIGIPGVLKLNQFIDVKVVDYGYRSITAVPYPLDINNASRETIKALPGIGRQRAIRILANRPYKNIEHFASSMDEPDIIKDLAEFLSFQ